MKKAIAMLLVCLLALALLAGCAAKTGTENAAESAGTVPDTDISAFRTLGDVFPYREDARPGYTETSYVYVFKKDGVYYRATADLTPEQSDALWGLDFLADDYEEKAMTMLAPLEIKTLENLSERIPSQEELDKLVGKTVQDLFDEGWTCWGWNLGDHILWMYGGPFSYTVEFTGELNDTEYFDESEAGSMTVKSVTYDGLGDATELD